LPAAGLEAGVVGAHPLRVADDLHVVDGHAEVVGEPARHLGRAHPAADPLAVGGDRHRGGGGHHRLGLDLQLPPDPGAGEAAQVVQVVRGRLAIHRGDHPGATAPADAEPVEEAHALSPDGGAGSVLCTIDSTRLDSSRCSGSPASVMSRTLRRTRSRMEMMPTRPSSEMTGRWRTLARVISLAASSSEASGWMAIRSSVSASWAATFLGSSPAPTTRRMSRSVRMPSTRSSSRTIPEPILRASIRPATSATLYSGPTVMRSVVMIAEMSTKQSSFVEAPVAAGSVACAGRIRGPG